MSNEKVVRIIVTVDDQYLSAIQSVATTLQSAGMKVNNVLSSVGMITGEVPQSTMSDLRKISGVIDVEVDQEMQAI